MDQYEAVNKLLELESLAQIRHELNNLPCTLLLPVARECLDRYALANYAGYFENQACNKLMEEIDKDLSFDCNSPYKFARSKLCLWLAKTILLECCSRLAIGFEKNTLTCRLVLFWQCLLKEPATELETVLNTLEHVQADCVSVATIAEAFLERMYAHLLYSQVSKAQICLNHALTTIGLEIQVVGVLGKRTRFQEKFIPQLVARAVGGNNPEEDDAGEDDSTLPANVLLHDDSLLETVRVAEADTSVSRTKLSGLSLSCMLASAILEQRIQSNEDLVTEKCYSYLNEIIAQRRNWAVQASALLQRSEFEKISMRRVERACMQMESLSKLVNNVGVKKVDEDTLRKRLKLLLASGMKPFWYVDLIHAQILHSIGCTSEALKVFEKYENWSSVIECYQSLGQLGKAERLIRELIAKNENESTYWCLLGDILHEPFAYEKAIEVSNGRSFRAHRSLGLLMLQRKQYDIAYKHLKISLELQPINSFAWFNFGCCTWKLEKWDEAARAYRECVRYEPAHFQAWNNLAAVYEKLNDAERAKAVLQEALKLNFDHIKLRENYMLLCLRTHDFFSAIYTFHAILDLEKQYKDDGIIEALTQKLIAAREENEESVKRLTEKMCELLGRITSQQTCSSTVWRCYAELKRPNFGSSMKDYEVYVMLLERAFKTCCIKDWHKNVDSCVAVLGAGIKLIESKKVLLEMKNVESDLVKSEIRVTLRPVITTIEKAYGADAKEASSACLNESILKAKAFLSSCL